MVKHLGLFLWERSKFGNKKSIKYSKQQLQGAVNSRHNHPPARSENKEKCEALHQGVDEEEVVDEEDLLLLLVACPYGMSVCVCTEHMWPMNGAAWREQLPDQTILPFLLLLLLLLPSTAAAATVVDFNQDPADPFFFNGSDAAFNLLVSITAAVAVLFSSR